jgi:phenylalanyl-tRNA synthetase beta chain
MLASYRWLKELCAFDASPDEVARRFTSLGLEVEGVKRYGDLPGVVIGEVRAKAPHPSKDKLTHVTVFDGTRELSIVCGASNVPAPGGRVLLATVGAKLPSGMDIAERKLAGVLSQGMLCSEVELDIGAEGDGIVVLDASFTAAPGTPVSEALELDDVVFEIGLTPNRPDCLGHVGLARELSVSFGAPLRLPVAHAPALAASGAVPVEIADPARCPRYAAAVVEGVKVGASPFWLRYRLHKLGLRAISNAVDVTNLVLVEYGYPTHAFDLAKLRGPKVIVRTAREGERLRTLDGEERALGPDDLAICDAEGPVAVAGVMGGSDSGVGEATTRVLVETAYFEPRSVRRTSRRLGIHSDASHRFERGVDPQAVPQVIARVVGLFAELAGAKLAGSAYEAFPAPIARAEIRYRHARCKALLGVQIPSDRAKEILSTLGCTVSDTADGFAVIAPSHRPDLTREEDLIEEVARVFGYDHLPTEPLRVRPSASAEPSPAHFVRRLKERAAAIGLTEVVNYAFVSPPSLEKAKVPTLAPRLLNPLSQERSVLRTSLLPGVAANVQRAQRHQVPSVAVFELARVFEVTDTELPNERHRLAIALAGARSEWLGRGEPVDFFDGKGVVGALVRPLTRASVSTELDPALELEAPYLHPRRAARLVLKGEPVGLLGELHPDVLEALDLTGPVVYAELDVAALGRLSGAASVPQVRGLPRFPASTRDLAVVVDETARAGDVAHALRGAGGALLEDVTLFDVFRGANLGTGKKSLAFRLCYRDPEGTLTDARVDDVHGRVLTAAEQAFGAARR